MSTSPSSSPSIIGFTEDERWELYAILDLRNKLSSGQARINERRTSKQRPGREGEGQVRSQIVEIRLTVNEYLICLAHRMIDENDHPLTEPDPKSFRIDDLRIRQ